MERIAAVLLYAEHIGLSLKVSDDDLVSHAGSSTCAQRKSLLRDRVHNKSPVKQRLTMSLVSGVPDRGWRNAVQ